MPASTPTITSLTTPPPTPQAEETPIRHFKTADGNLEIYVKLPSALVIEENAFPLIEKRASKVKLVFLELEGDNPLKYSIDGGDISAGSEAGRDLDSEMLNKVFNELKDFYWEQSNHKLEFTGYQFLGKFVREDLSQENMDWYIKEIIEGKKSEITQQKDEYVDIIAVIDDDVSRVLHFGGENNGRYLRDDWNLIIISSFHSFDTNVLAHEIGHSNFVIDATDWYSEPTPEEYNKRPFNGLVDYDLFAPSNMLSFTVANKVNLARLNYTAITGSPPYERTITLTPTSELTENTPVYKIPLEFVHNGDESYLRSYVFDLRNDIEGGQGVYVQEIVEMITSSFDHIYLKPYWSVIVPRKTVSLRGKEETIPYYLSNRGQANDGRTSNVSDEFVDIELVDEVWNGDSLESATIKIKVKKQNIALPKYKSRIYLTELDGIPIAYIKNEGFAIRPIVFKQSKKVSFYPPSIFSPGRIIWVFTPIDGTIKHSDEATNFVAQKYGLRPEDAIEKLNIDFNLDLPLREGLSKVREDDITKRGFMNSYVLIKEELDNPIIGFVYFDPLNKSFKGIFLKNFPRTQDFPIGIDSSVPPPSESKLNENIEP